jgi:alkylhydroperoxidase family enzyme
VTGDGDEQVHPGPLAGWRSTTPAIFDLVDQIERRAERELDPAILGPTRSAVASILGPGGLRADGTGSDRATSPRSGTPPGVVAVCVDFAEQFVVDVSSTTEGQRSALTAALGRDAFTFVQVLYVTDVFARMRIGFDRLGPPAPGVAVAVVASTPASGPTEAGDDLWTLLERFMQLVAQRDALDPLTAELVRLRGARVHDCRLCRSRLSVRALDSAGERSVFDRDDPDDPALDERQRVALRLTDALVTQPSSIDTELAAAVRERFSPDEIVEIVLDVARNAANKIAVALGADAPVVADGIEYYDLDAGGTVVADADMAVVRAATA